MTVVKINLSIKLLKHFFSCFFFSFLSSFYLFSSLVFHFLLQNWLQRTAHKPIFSHR